MSTFDFSTAEGILDFIGFLIKVGVLVEPTLVSIWHDWTDKKITAEEAEAAAADKFAALRAGLADPHGDAQKLNAAEDDKLRAKFPPADKEEPKT